MPGRNYSSDEYRYGFNGMERDEELKGSGNSYDFGARMQDPRLGRWLSLDPLAQDYLSLSPYNFVSNSPILFIDPDGMKIANPNDPDTKRYKASLKRSRAGRKIWRYLKRNKSLIHIHYVDEGSDDETTERLFEFMQNAGANGAVISGTSYNRIVNGESATKHTEDNTFNPKTGEWEPNKEDHEEIHIIINQYGIMMTNLANALYSDTPLTSEEEDVEEDLEYHHIEVHEGFHAGKQKSYDYTEVEKVNGGYKDTGKIKRWDKRKGEQEAEEYGIKAKEQLRKKINRKKK